MTHLNLFRLSPERLKLEGHGELSLSVNMFYINMHVSNWSPSRAGLHYFSISPSAGVLEAQVKLWRLWNRPDSVGTGAFTSREEAN